MKVLAVIPSRYASTRLPGKPLSMIHGKPMIQWVWERTNASPLIHETVVATDDERIFKAVEQFGGKAVMTSGDHISGTDRIREAVEILQSDAEVILNVQGYEPTIEASHLEPLIRLFEKGIDIGTLVSPFRRIQDFQDPNRVKAVLSKEGRALYFSRSPVPHDRGDTENLQGCFQHIGVYAYRKEVLLEISALAPSPLEKKESLEQLRWLEHGYRIHAAQVLNAPIGVDTPEDLERVRSLLS